MDNLSEMLYKIKQDIRVLSESLVFMAEELIKINEEIVKLKTEKENSYDKNNPADALKVPTNQQIFPAVPTDFQHKNSLFKPLNTKNQLFSTGNEGVPTDRQTDQQTDKNTYFKHNNTSIDKAAQILDSLDSVKKDIRVKFKRLTEQEFMVFSTIYQLEEEKGHVDYKILAERLNLTESSIRDYVGKLIKKGIPLEKNKLNNKNIQLSVSQNLRKIASFHTILQLREL